MSLRRNGLIYVSLAMRSCEDGPHQAYRCNALGQRLQDTSQLRKMSPLMSSVDNGVHWVLGLLCQLLKAKKIAVKPKTLSWW